MKIESEIEVRHVKNILQFFKTWNTGDRFEGDGEWDHEARLLHIYESKDKIFRVNVEGVLLSSEFKDGTMHKYIKKRE